MHACIPSHGLKRSWHSCPRPVNDGNKITPSMHHPQRRNVTTSMVGLKTVTYAKIPSKMVNPRDLAGERRRFKKIYHKYLTQNGETQRSRWEHRRRIHWCDSTWERPSGRHGFDHRSPALQAPGRLLGLVVKASTSRAEDPGFESRLQRDFSRSSPVT